MVLNSMAPCVCRVAEARNCESRKSCPGDLLEAPGADKLNYCLAFCLKVSFTQSHSCLE